jgi:hypothetical protein
MEEQRLKIYNEYKTRGYGVTTMAKDKESVAKTVRSHIYFVKMASMLVQQNAF